MPDVFTDLEAQILSESPADSPVVIDQGDLDYETGPPQHGDPDAPPAGRGATDG